MKAPKPVAVTKPPVIRRERFNLNDDARYKANYNYTNEELLALEELRLEIAHRLDKKVTKNDLMRAALHLLLEDHEANGERSYATRKIRRRATYRLRTCASFLGPDSLRLVVSLDPRCERDVLGPTSRQVLQHLLGKNG